MKTIEQQNAIIAEFMGGFDGWDFKMFETGTWEFQTPETLKTLITFKSNSIKTECFSTTIFKSYEVKFHTSWDWLMPVVEKCLKYCHDKMLNEWESCFTDTFLTLSVKSMHETTFQFIEWYNANK